MSFLTKLLRKPIIKNGYSFLGYDHVYSMETVKKALFKNDYYEPLPPTIQSITLSKHAWERWNERIGPPTSFQELTNLLNQLVLINRRITAISDRRGLIDSDILFIYQKKETSIHITTFYGRLSHHPALRNIRDLKAYQLIENERIILSLPSHLLTQQQLPVIPIDYVEFEGRTISYVIQKYRVSINNTERILLFLTETSKFGHIRMLTIDPLDFFETLLNHSVLYVMLLMGYRDFVMEHLQFYKPDAILKAMQRYDTYLKRRFEVTQQVLAKTEEKK
jgi:hypothetical protein